MNITLKKASVNDGSIGTFLIYRNTDGSEKINKVIKFSEQVKFLEQFSNKN